MNPTTVRMHSTNNFSALNAISPLDGRYHSQLCNLSDLFSEFSLIKRRLQVEIDYLLFLAEEKLIPNFTIYQRQQLKKIIDNFDSQQAIAVKDFEKQTKHDVKAVERYLQDQFKKRKIKNEQYIHLALTSEDVNSIAYSLLLQSAKENILVLELKKLLLQLSSMADKYSCIPMLARTHGQPAVPTTVGKELVVFAMRLLTELQLLQELPVEAKLTGAVGNFNAHCLVFPSVNWLKLSRKFITKLGLKSQLFTTQILPTESYTRIFSSLVNINNILLDFSQDMWRYISDDYFSQKIVAGQVGSSTMPQKINPIDFENSEGNLGLANSLLNHFITKLPISRLQRDLSDSTVKRNFGVAIAHSILAYRSLQKGLQKLSINKLVLQQSLEDHWEILAEAFQVTLRANGDTKGYEKLQKITQGKKVTAEVLATFITDNSLSVRAKRTLAHLTPASYLGLASEITQNGVKAIAVYLKQK